MKNHLKSVRIDFLIRKWRCHGDLTRSDDYPTHSAVAYLSSFPLYQSSRSVFCCLRTNLVASQCFRTWLSGAGGAPAGLAQKLHFLQRFAKAHDAGCSLTMRTSFLESRVPDFLAWSVPLTIPCWMPLSKLNTVRRHQGCRTILSGMPSKE